MEETWDSIFKCNFWLCRGARACFYSQVGVWDKWCPEAVGACPELGCAGWSLIWCRLGCHSASWTERFFCWGAERKPGEEPYNISFCFSFFEDSMARSPPQDRTGQDRTSVPRAGCVDRWFWARVCGQTGSGMWQTGRAGIWSGRSSGNAEFLGSACLRRRTSPEPHRHSEGLGLSHAWTGNYHTDPGGQTGERQ